MKRFVGMLGALIVTLGVVVPIGWSDDGGPAKEPSVTCTRTVFAARILRVGDDALVVRPGDSDVARPIVVRVDDETVIRKGDVVSDSSALIVGKRARFLVRVCRRGERRLVTARVIPLAPPPPADVPPPPREDPPPTPNPAPEVCGQGEFNTVLVAVSSTSITVRTT